MSHRQHHTLQAPPFFAPSSPFENTQHTLDDPVERLLERARTGHPLEAQALRRLARESFEAGFAAGASRLVATAPIDAPHSPASPSPHARLRDRPASRAAAPAPTSAPVPTRETASETDPIATLSPRRLEVLQLVARGLTNREIGDVLSISTNTVKAHLKSILEILDLTNRTEAAMALHDFEASR